MKCYKLGCMGYVDAYYHFENHPKITEACDVILANCYPFWEGCSLEYAFFEAFDELWKGSDEPMEPEKHWGIFTVDRKPKKVMQPFFPGFD